MTGLNCQVSAEPPAADALKRYRLERVRMGVPWTLEFYTDSDQHALDSAERVWDRIKQLDQIFSDYDPDSEVGQLCRTSQPGKAVQVSEDLWKVLQFSAQLSRQTEGKFDITVGPITDLWRRAWRKRALPDRELLQQELQKVGYQKVQLHCDTRSVTFAVPEMQLDLGAIAKGYAAEEACQVLAKRGISRSLVDASGDLVLGDPPPGSKGWTISIAPLSASKPSRAAETSATPAVTGLQPTEFLLLANCSIATSGDANRYVELDGVRYSHIVDPHTGQGLTHSSSVTVIAANGMLADALASALSVLPPEQGLELLKKHQAEAYLVLNQDGTLQTYQSAGYGKHRLTP